MVGSTIGRHSLERLYMYETFPVLIIMSQTLLDVQSKVHGNCISLSYLHKNLIVM